MNSVGATKSKISVVFILVAALVVSLGIFALTPNTAQAKTYGSAHVSKTVGKAYAKFLKAQGAKNFVVKNLGGSTPVLIVNGESWVPGQVSVCTLYLYKKGSVKKLSTLETYGSYGYEYGKRCLRYGHNHWMSFVSVKNGKLQNKQFTMYYESSLPMYRGYNPKYAEYCLNGKRKQTGKKAIDTLWSLNNKNSPTKSIYMKSNTERNRKAVLGFK